MEICLVSPEHNDWGGIGHALRRLGRVLASRHDVTLIHSGRGPSSAPTPTPGVREVFADFEAQASTAFACENHQRSAAVLAAIEEAYRSTGPDYLEACDYLAHGLVPLQARRAGHPQLRDTLIGVRMAGTAEMVALHDGVTSTEMRFTADMEREQFRLADRLIWRGGDSLDLYRRFYADLKLPEAVRIRPPLAPPERAPSPTRRESGRPLRLLYVGRLQRFKGAIDLVEACVGLPADDWDLTMIGADTATAPLGQSVRATLEAACGGDPRVRLRDPVPHSDLERIWGEHDLLVIPSAFEVWSNVATEAMRAGLPILATPVGGPAEIVVPGVTGWLADGFGPEPLRRALTRLLTDRDEVERVRSSGAIFDRVRVLTDPSQALDAYERMLGERPRSPVVAVAPASGEEPPVTGVIPYFRSADYVEEAVGSLLGQTHRDLDVLIVDDGSFRPEDAVLDRLAADPRVRVVAQPNHGENRARNLGIHLARGEYVIMLDADNVLEPEFVSRAVALLRREPELSYVTSWLSYIAADGSPMTAPAAYAPLGNSVLAAEEANWDGDAIAVLPRRLFTELDFGYADVMQADWDLYRRLRDDGRLGAVIPERLARYRVRGDSMTKGHDETLHARSWEEGRTRRALRQTRWTAER